MLPFLQKLQGCNFIEEALMGGAGPGESGRPGFELHEVLELFAHGVAVWVCDGNNFLRFGFVS